jgi:hypothetical protein
MSRILLRRIKKCKSLLISDAIYFPAQLNFLAESYYIFLHFYALSNECECDRRIVMIDFESTVLGHPIAYLLIIII